MKFNKDECDVFIPDGIEPEKAFERVTHLGIGAHQDDLEIMSWDGVLRCFGKKDQWYMGVVVTNGAGSPRDGIYADCTDAEMRDIRKNEQRKAAFVGDYAACVQLAHTSGDIKDGGAKGPLEDLMQIIRMTRPNVVYTHNLADKHDTHVAVALRTIAAIRALPPEERPEKLYGCEVWRGLDWLCDDEKVVFDVSGHENIAAALVGVHDSQVAGGKRYDTATDGRRRANATYLASHAVDNISHAIYGIDMTELIKNSSIDPKDFIMDSLKRFQDEVCEKVGRFS